MEYTTLAQRPHLLSATIDLIEKSFEYRPPNYFAVDFATLMDKKNFSHNHLLIAKDEQVIAHLGVRTRILGENIPIALLGGIAVAKNFRGQGHLRNLMNRILEAYQEQVALFGLWSNQEGLYQKFNFSLSGGQLEVNPPGMFQAPSNYHSTKLHLLSPLDMAEIQAIYQSTAQRYLTLNRDKSDWEVIKKITSIDWYLRKNTQGSIVAYFCCNKGQDLQNVIHEFGCYPELHNTELIDLAQGPLWLPEAEKKIFPNAKITYLAYFRPGNFAVFRDLISIVTHGEIIIRSFTNNVLGLHFRGAYFQESFANFFSLLFGPHRSENFASFVNPLFIWGTDSI